MDQLIADTSNALQHAETPASLMEVLRMSLTQLSSSSSSSSSSLSSSAAADDHRNHNNHHVAFLRMLWESVVCKWGWAIDPTDRHDVVARLFVTAKKNNNGGAALTNALIIMAEGVSNISAQLRNPATPLSSIQVRVLERSCIACVDVLGYVLFSIDSEVHDMKGIIAPVHYEFLSMPAGKRDGLSPQVVHLLCVMPDLVLGALGRSADDMWMPDNYFKRLCGDVIRWYYCQESSDGGGGGVSVNGGENREVRAGVMWTLLSKVCSIGHSRHVAGAWLDLRANVATDSSGTLAHTVEAKKDMSFWTVMPSTCAEALVSALLSAVGQCPLPHAWVLSRSQQQQQGQQQQEEDEEEEGAIDARRRLLGCAFGSFLTHPRTTQPEPARPDVGRNISTSNKVSAATIRWLIEHKFLLSRRRRPVAPAALWPLLDLLRKQDNNTEEEEDEDETDTEDEITFVGLATRLARTWSEQVVSLRGDASHVSFLTGVLRGCVRRLTKQEIEQSGLLVLLISGVQTYLENSTAETRTHGMLLAEEMSVVLDPKQTLDFGSIKSVGQGSTREIQDRYAESGIALLVCDEVEEHEGWNVSVQQQQQQQPGYPESETVTTEFRQAQEKVLEQTTTTQQQQQKSVWYDSDSSSSGEEEEQDEQQQQVDSDDSDDDDVHVDLLSQGAEEEERTQQEQEDIECDRVAPLYLSDCVEQLYADDRTKTRAALRVVPRFVKEMPGNLRLVAPALTKALLQLSNRFGMDDFDELRMDALVSVTVASPYEAVGLLRSNLFVKNVGIGTMLDVLRVLVAAAQRLACVGVGVGANPDDKNDMSANVTSPPIENIGTVLRRWGQRKSAKRTSKVNKFAPVASLFFGAVLTQPLDAETGQRTDLLVFERDASVLARVVLSLGALIECSVNLPIVEHLVKSMLPLVWWARKSEHAEVRRSVVFCLGHVHMAWPSGLGDGGELGDRMLDMQDWLCEVATSDTDDLCRSYAKAVLRSVVESRT